MKMNLYIWGDSGSVSYGADSIIVMAPNLREAGKLAERRCADWSFGREHDRTIVPPKLAKKPDKIIRNRGYAAYFKASE
jgi:hypothetical protein